MDKQNKNNHAHNAAPHNVPGASEAAQKSDNVTISKQEYDELKSKSSERDGLYDKYLRMQAEFDNAKKRMEKERVDTLKYANESFVFELIPILDSLEIAEKHIKEAKDFKAVQEGVDMIQVQIQKFLKDLGIEKVKTAGEKFDPHVHDPMEAVEMSGKDDGMIIEELKSGYRLNGKLIRPASVKIVKNKA